MLSFQGDCMTIVPNWENLDGTPVPTGQLHLVSVKYVQKRKLRANFIKTGVSILKGAKSSLVVVLQQV
jgi:hypothetical protein